MYDKHGSATNFDAKIGVGVLGQRFVRLIMSRFDG